MFKKLFEGFFKNTNSKDSVVNSPTKANPDLNTIINDSNNYTVWQLISRIRDISQTREYKYAEYDIMSTEVIINSALNMYADDSTQVDINSGNILSITSSDEVLVRDLYAFLDRINFKNFIWNIAYDLSKYGNKYLKVYLTENGKDISHLESIDDPSCVLDLYHQGKPTYFAENPDDRTFYKESRNFNLYDHDSFIHYFIRSTSQSDTIELIDRSKVNENGEPLVVKYKVIEGESLLEGVRVIYRILQSLEDSLLAARLAKSDFFRIFNIEVGNSSNTDARLIVNKVKKLFDSTVSMNLRDGRYNAMKQPRAWADPIFNSTSNGKGAVTMEAIGGDFEVKSIVDIDYFTNKLFAGLRIPKPFLGFEESLGGSLDQSGTLSQLDVRYSRFIRKIIDAVVQGTTDLCNLWLKIKNRHNSIDNFKVVYTSPSSLEDYSNLKELKERASIVSELVNTITSNASEVDSAAVLKELLNQFVPYQAFLTRVNPLLEKAIRQEESEEDEEGFSEDEYGDERFSGGIDFDFPKDEEEFMKKPLKAPSEDEPSIEIEEPSKEKEKPSTEKPSKPKE